MPDHCLPFLRNNYFIVGEDSRNAFCECVRADRALSVVGIACTRLQACPLRR